MLSLHVVVDDGFGSLELAFVFHELGGGGCFYLLEFRLEFVELLSVLSLHVVVDAGFGSLKLFSLQNLHFYNLPLLQTHPLFQRLVAQNRALQFPHQVNYLCVVFSIAASHFAQLLLQFHHPPLFTLLDRRVKVVHVAHACVVAIAVREHAR